MGVTARDIREIRTVLVGSGMECHVHSACGEDVRLEIVCERSMTWGNARNIIDTACFLIRGVRDGIVITYLSGEDVGNYLHLWLMIR